MTNRFERIEQKANTFHMKNVCGYFWALSIWGQGASSFDISCSNFT
jgi:hypothetical protein